MTNTQIKYPHYFCTRTMNTSKWYRVCHVNEAIKKQSIPYDEFSPLNSHSVRAFHITFFSLYDQQIVVEWHCLAEVRLSIKTAFIREHNRKLDSFLTLQKQIYIDKQLDILEYVTFYVYLIVFCWFLMIFRLLQVEVE